MNTTIHAVALGQPVAVNVRVAGRKKPTKVHLEKGTKLPIVSTENRNGVPYLTCLSSFGLLLIGDCDPHTILTVDAPSDIPLEQFVVESPVVFQRGQKVALGAEE